MFITSYASLSLTAYAPSAINSSVSAPPASSTQVQCLVVHFEKQLKDGLTFSHMVSAADIDPSVRSRRFTAIAILASFSSSSQKGSYSSNPASKLFIYHCAESVERIFLVAPAAHLVVPGTMSLELAQLKFSPSVRSLALLAHCKDKDKTASSFCLWSLVNKASTASAGDDWYLTLQQDSPYECVPSKWSISYSPDSSAAASLLSSLHAVCFLSDDALVAIAASPKSAPNFSFVTLSIRKDSKRSAVECVSLGAWAEEPPCFNEGVSFTLLPREGPLLPLILAIESVPSSRRALSNAPNINDSARLWFASLTDHAAPLAESLLREGLLSMAEAADSQLSQTQRAFSQHSARIALRSLEPLLPKLEPKLRDSMHACLWTALLRHRFEDFEFGLDSDVSRSSTFLTAFRGHFCNVQDLMWQLKEAVTTGLDECGSDTNSAKQLLSYMLTAVSKASSETVPAFVQSCWIIFLEYHIHMVDTLSALHLLTSNGSQCEFYSDEAASFSSALSVLHCSKFCRADLLALLSRCCSLQLFDAAQLLLHHLAPLFFFSVDKVLSHSLQPLFLCLDQVPVSADPVKLCLLLKAGLSFDGCMKLISVIQQGLNSIMQCSQWEQIDVAETLLPLPIKPLQHFFSSLLQACNFTSLKLKSETSVSSTQVGNLEEKDVLSESLSSIRLKPGLENVLPVLFSDMVCSWLVDRVFKLDRETGQILDGWLLLRVACDSRQLSRSLTDHGNEAKMIEAVSDQSEIPPVPLVSSPSPVLRQAARRSQLLLLTLYDAPTLAAALTAPQVVPLATLSLDQLLEGSLEQRLTMYLSACSTPEILSEALRAPFFQRYLYESVNEAEPLLHKWLRNQAPKRIDLVATVFVESRTARVRGLRLLDLEQQEPLLNLALDCIYLCSAPSGSADIPSWRSANDIFESLPRRPTGALAPNLQLLHERLDLLEKQLTAVELLSLYNINRPMSFFLQFASATPSLISSSTSGALNSASEQKAVPSADYLMKEVQHVLVELARSTALQGRKEIDYSQQQAQDDNTSAESNPTGSLMSSGSQTMRRTFHLLRRAGKMLDLPLAPTQTQLRTSWSVSLRDVSDLWRDFFNFLSLNWCLCTFLQAFLAALPDIHEPSAAQWLAVRSLLLDLKVTTLDPSNSGSASSSASSLKASSELSSFVGSEIMEMLPCSLPPILIEKVVLAAARDLFNSADSPQHAFITRARGCLLLLPLNHENSNRAVPLCNEEWQTELNLVHALSQLSLLRQQYCSSPFCECLPDDFLNVVPAQLRAWSLQQREAYFHSIMQLSSTCTACADCLAHDFCRCDGFCVYGATIKDVAFQLGLSSREHQLGLSVAILKANASAVNRAPCNFKAAHEKVRSRCIRQIHTLCSQLLIDERYEPAAQAILPLLQVFLLGVL